MNFQSRWFSSFEYLFSVLFLFFLLGQPTASGCWSIYQCGVVFSGSILLYLERYYSHLCISVEHFSGFSSFFSGLKPHTFFWSFWLSFSTSFRFIAQYGVKGPRSRSRSDSTALVGLLVGWWFSLLCLLVCSVRFGFPCFSLSLSFSSNCQSRYVTLCRWFLGFPFVYRSLLSLLYRVLFLFILYS